jgi:outer membrane protein assembly factor BamB
LFVSSGYNVGCTGFRISADGDRWRCEKLYAGNELQSHHGGLVLVDGYVYGLGRRQLKCIDIRTGEEKWAANSVGKGSIAYADGHLVVRSERGGGSLALVEATPLGHREKGRFDPPARSQEPAWAYPVIWGGRLYIRDQGALLCYDLRAPGIDDATGEKKKKKNARIY